MCKLGHKFSEEFKQKISLANKGHIAWNKGKSVSEQLKQRISLTLKNKHLSSWNKGKCWSKEHKQKISLTKRGRHLSTSEETKLKISLAMKGGIRNHHIDCDHSK